MTKPPQARNAIHRALSYVAGLRFTKTYRDACKEHFRHSCAYCGIQITPGSRNGHLDHAIAISTSASECHLVYACGSCNGDQKRELGWQRFLKQKCGDDTEMYECRKLRIEQWFAIATPATASPSVVAELESSAVRAKAAFDREVDRIRQLVDTEIVAAEAGNHAVNGSRR